MRTSTAHEVGWFAVNLASRAREGRNIEKNQLALTLRIPNSPVHTGPSLGTEK